MWKLGVAFIRGLNIYGKNRITQRQLMRALKQIEGDDLRILKIVKTDDIIFQKNNIQYATAGSRIEKRLKALFGKNIYVTTRSLKTIDRVQASVDKMKGLGHLQDYQK